MVNKRIISQTSDTDSVIKACEDIKSAKNEGNYAMMYFYIYIY